MSRWKYCINTFGLGLYLHSGTIPVWAGLLEAGVSVIEPCISFHDIDPMPDDYRRVWETGLFDGCISLANAPAYIAVQRNRGFELHSFQFQNTPFTVEELTAAIPFMKDNGLQYAIYSFMDSSVTKIQNLAPTIRNAVTVFRAAGVELLVHNHDMEWKPDAGTTVMDWLLENVPELRFEIDLGWTEYAGRSCLEILNQYPGRFPLLHFKEVAPGAVAGMGKPFCTAPGSGILPLRELLEKVETMELEDYAIIIDQDDSIRGNIVADIAQGIGCMEAIRNTEQGSIEKTTV